MYSRKKLWARQSVKWGSWLPRTCVRTCVNDVYEHDCDMAVTGCYYARYTVVQKGHLQTHAISLRQLCSSSCCDVAARGGLLFVESQVYT